MSLTDDAIRQIKGMIQSGQLRPGDRLPPEHVLSERLGLSRSSLREAVKMLEALRVLDVRRGDGTYVTSLQPQLLLEAMSFILDFHQSRAVLEVLEVRGILENASARAAATRVTPEDLARMTAAIDNAEAASSIEDLVEHDLEFHAAIATASGNGYLASLIDAVSGQTVRARVWRGLTESSAVDRTLLEHRRIVQAIASGDPELAGALMTVHVGGVSEWMQASLEVDEETPER
ncbi:FadR/GntR family transcriptional regulator [Pseudactinotalea sp.]|uniref:FadR/GntR family transcriptional regulator n=1 Tax=Pseudactinotalea sp. TaxID=1926260 RepID=UPI003B3B7AF1